MIVRSHADYVSFGEALRFRASYSPNSPWTLVTIPADEPMSARRWGALAEWLRSTERSFDVTPPFQLGALAKLVKPDIGDTRPHEKIIAELLEVFASATTDADTRDYIAELVALALRAVDGGAAFEGLVSLFVAAAGPFETPRHVRWLLDLSASATSEARLSAIEAALPRTLLAVDRAEFDVQRLRLLQDSEAARAQARVLLDVVAPMPVVVGAATKIGSAEHRVALTRLRVLQELSYRANVVDNSVEAGELARTALEEALAIGLPASSETPTHDLGGFDVLAQVAAADWLFSAIAADTSVANEAFITMLNPASLPNVAAAARRKLIRGRFQTDHDAGLELLDDAASATLEGRLDVATEKLDLALDIAERLRSFSLESAAMERMARVDLRRLESAETALERVEYATDAIRHGARAGASKLVERAGRELAGVAGASGADLKQSLSGDRRVERVARMVAVRELAPVVSDEELGPWCSLTTKEARGPFSMDSRFDVQRAAIAASAKVLVEAMGLRKDDEFESIASATVSMWASLCETQTRATVVVVHAISDAIGEVLRLPLSRFPLVTVVQLLEVAGSLPKDTSRIDGTAWVNFVRPAIEIVAGSRVNTSAGQAEKIRLAALSLIPKWTPAIASSGQPVREAPAFPPDQHELLALTYRCLLGEPPDPQVIHAAVDAMTAYCSYFADGTKRAGLRMPIRPDLALAVARYGREGDEGALLGVLLRMTLSPNLDVSARAEAIDAVLDWVRRDAPSGRTRLDALDKLRPGFLTEVMAVVQSPEAAVPERARGFGDPDRVVGALLVLSAELTRQELASGSVSGAEQANALAAIAENLGISESVQIRGSAGSVGATLLLESTVSQARRDRLAVGFLSNSGDPEERVALATMGGFRWAVESNGTQALDAKMGGVLALHLAERARAGTRAIQREARLTLRAMQIAGGASSSAVDVALKRARFSEADERAWRRHLLIRASLMSRR